MSERERLAEWCDNRAKSQVIYSDHDKETAANYRAAAALLRAQPAQDVVGAPTDDIDAWAREIVRPYGRSLTNVEAALTLDVAAALRAERERALEDAAQVAKRDLINEAAGDLTAAAIRALSKPQELARKPTHVGPTIMCENEAGCRSHENCLMAGTCTYDPEASDDK